jgi:sulfate-transporting ATPase
VGPIFGSTLTDGSIGTPLGNSLFSGISQYLDLIGGVSIIFIALQNQNGIVHEMLKQIRWVARRIPGATKVLSFRSRGKRTFTLREHSVERCEPMVLQVQNLVVKYGPVTAADGVNFVIEPGRVIGLIGPNGAGKTTVIDAITGFTRMSGGQIQLDGRDISRLKVFARARRGVSRSFQSLELFEDSTVLENLRTASDGRDRLSYRRNPRGRTRGAP